MSIDQELLPTHTSLVDCGALSRPANGLITFTGTVFKSIARYSCDPGYGPVGNTTIVCQANGNWSESPMCRSMGELNNEVSFM